jgi:transglutaminase-like putative cysteine protease
MLKGRILFFAGLVFCFHIGAEEPVSKKDISIIEDFNGKVWPRWRDDVDIVDGKEAKTGDNFNNTSKFAKLGGAEKGTKELTLDGLFIKEPSILSFRYKTEISSRAGQSFRVFIDGKQCAALEGVDSPWRVQRLKIDAGDHKLKFEVTNKSGAKIIGGYNAVYLDDLTVFPDKAASITLSPRGEQHTFLGAEGSSRLKFTATALYADGSPKKDAGEFIYSATGGEINYNGEWTPHTAGSFTVSAKLGNFSVVSGKLVVHDADFIKEPFHYSGTGKTYKGYVGGERAKAAGKMPGRESLTITNPAVADFDADAFFLLEGVVERPRGKNYARVFLQKTVDSKTKLSTWYIVKDKFSRRIWLPFGEGEYRIEVLEFDSASVTTPPKGEGMFRGGSYSVEPLVFTVNNIRSEEGTPDGDGRAIYPSFNIQSDDYRITNLLNSITAGVSGEPEKIEAIHDYIVSALTYDTASYSNNMRSRKMDAVSVIENSTGVCEGYTHLSAALLRAAGIPARVVVNKVIAHAWNQVWTDGAWKFYDATWDDPVPARGPEIVQTPYFLLDSLSGGDNRHRGAGTVFHGDLE